MPVQSTDQGLASITFSVPSGVQAGASFSVNGSNFEPEWAWSEGAAQYGSAQPAKTMVAAGTVTLKAPIWEAETLVVGTGWGGAPDPSGFVNMEEFDAITNVNTILLDLANKPRELRSLRVDNGGRVRGTLPTTANQLHTYWGEGEVADAPIVDLDQGIIDLYQVIHLAGEIGVGSSLTKESTACTYLYARADNTAQILTPMTINLDNMGSNMTLCYGRWRHTFSGDLRDFLERNATTMTDFVDHSSRSVYTWPLGTAPVGGTVLGRIMAEPQAAPGVGFTVAEVDDFLEFLTTTTTWRTSGALIGVEIEDLNAIPSAIGLGHIATILGNGCPYVADNE